jgi:alpha-D-ribose 1-methylphosphonate 5-triphosphate synthase subunit PhnH
VPAQSRIFFAFAETSLSVISGDSSSIDERFFSRMTNARIAAAENALFLFACRDFPSTILRAQRGTLVDPHLGATTVMETDSVAESGKGAERTAGSTRWKLTGPGIKDAAYIRVFSSDPLVIRNAFQARNEACLEFPLGVDLILLDKSQKIVSIPRTTILEEM